MLLEFPDVNETVLNRELELERLLPGDGEAERTLRAQIRALIDEEVRLAREAAPTDGGIPISDELGLAPQCRAATRGFEERLRYAVNSARLYMWDVDRSTGSVAYSGNVEQVIGFARAETFAALIESVHPEDRAALFAAFERVASEGSELAIDYRLVNPQNGEIIWVRAQGVADVDRKHVVGFAQNVTEQKRRFENMAFLGSHQEDCASVALRDEILERRRSEAIRRNLLRQVVTAQEEERRRISRELHDEVGQHLAAVMLGLKSLEAAPDSRERKVRLKELRTLAEKLGQEVHDIALRLRPTALDDLGLVRTLANYLEDCSTRSGIEIDFHSSGLAAERLPADIESTIYRIVQEALTNVVKHAEATRVSVLLERRATELAVIIEDNGRGFGAESVPGDVRPHRLGLLGMSERAALVDGKLSIESNPGDGTTVFVKIPLPS